MLTWTNQLSAADRRFLRTFLPDAEDAPWMAVTDLHLLALIAALLPLRWFAERAHPEWYIASELALFFPVDDGKNFVVPDLLVALAPNHPRTSFDAQAEGGFPPFVLEIVSRESRERDTGTGEGKVRLYGLQGAEEYAIFDPDGSLQPPLQGYHRTPTGEWVSWPVGVRGELVSRVLGLTLVADETLLRFEDAQGRRLPTPDEERLRAIYEHERAEREREQAEREREQAARERERAETAEAKLARLQAVLERHGITPDQ